MKLTIKKTQQSSFFQTETLTREAFWNQYNPGCDEHLVLHQLRNSSSYIADLDLIAIHDDEIIAHIICTKARVIDDQAKEYEVICLGPVSVLPLHQNTGVGTQLIQYAISEAKRLGCKGMILFGNPQYYQRFGFRNAQHYKITTKEDKNFEAFMALELQENGLSDVRGRFFEDEAYLVDEAELIEFEKKFPHKEKGKPRFDISQ